MSDSPAPAPAPSEPASSPRSQPKTPKSSAKRKGLPNAVPDTPIPQPKKARTARGGREQLKDIELKPGDPEKTKTFAKVFKSQGECCAYVRLRDVADMKRLVMSAYVLKIYNTIHAVKAALRPNVLALIRDCQDKLATDEDPRKQFPIQSDETHVIWQMALGVCQLRRLLQKALSESDMFTQKEQDALQQEFGKLTGRKPPRFDISLVKIPDLGPFESLGESDLEPYNRCLQLLCYTGFITNNSTWKGRFESGKQQWDQTELIKPSHVPHWLRPKNKGSSNPPPPDKPPVEVAEEPKKPSLDINIKWNYAAKGKEPTEYRLNAEEEGKNVGKLEMRFTIEPDATGPQVRDKIRSLFALDELEAQLHTLRLILDADMESIQCFNVLQDEWKLIQEALWETAYSKSTFLFTVRALQDGEELWEN